MPIITLLTDYGLADPFVGVMKGVLYSRAPRVAVVDLCHGIAPQAVAEAAYWLDRCQPWFPPGTLHVAVVDPGVGTARAILAASIAGQRFLAPDNGLLSQRLLEYPGADVRAVNLDGLGIHAASATFHGRDIFAPLAALIASGTKQVAELGERAQPKPSALPTAQVGAGEVRGHVVTIDHFGNLISNIDVREPRLGSFGLGPLAARAPAAAQVEIGPHALPLRSTYADVASGELVALVNAFDSIEIAERDGSAARRLGAVRGASVRLLLRGAGS